MTTKAKTQVSATPTPAPAGGQSLFDSQDTQPESDEQSLDYEGGQIQMAGEPPNNPIQQADTQGHHFEQVAIAEYRPAKPIQRRIQRQTVDGVKERWEDGAVSLKPLETGPLADNVSKADEKWEDGAVTLKAEPNSLTAPPLQTKSEDGSFEAGSTIESRLQSSKGGGQPLSNNTRDFMESRFGNDFGGVRVHTNAEAVQMNQNLKAQAFTHGNDIYFNSGKYNPESTGGKRLLAHELTHTIQQTGPSTVNPKRLAQKTEKINKSPLATSAQPVAASVAPKVQRQKISQVATRPVGNLEEVSVTIQPDLMVGAVGDRYEQEADRMADQVVKHTQEGPETDTLQRTSDRAPSISHGVQGVLQRDKKDDVKKDVDEGIKGINQEINSKQSGEADTSAADKGGDAGRNMANEAKSKLGNASDEDKAEEAAEDLKNKSENEAKKAQDEGENTGEKETQKQQSDVGQAEQKALEEKETQQKKSEEAEAENNGEEAAAEEQPEGADGSAESGEVSPELTPIGTPEHLPDPGLVEAPDFSGTKAPSSPDEDPAFAAVVDQSEHVAAQQSTHKPAVDKAREAQDAVNDPAQQSRRAQATQSEEAAGKKPQLFDRESFVSALLSVLESNKPKSQKDIEEGKGMDGSSEKVTAEVNKAKSKSEGELKESATRAPDPASEDPKPVTQAPEAVEEAGEKPPDESINATAATPKPRTEEEVEKPLQETQQALENLVPKNKKDLPPIQAKLMVGAPGDKFEQEADHMADTVMAMNTPKLATEPAKHNKQVPATPQPETATDPAVQTETENGQEVQRQPQVTQLPDIQLLPGLFLQRQAIVEAETPTQKDNPVPLDENRLKSYEKDAGVDATGALEEGKQHFGGGAQQKFRQTEASVQADTEKSQTDTIAAGNDDMFATRMEEMLGVQESQQESQTTDESERTRVSQEIQAIYDETKGNVNGTLTRMDQRVNDEFAATDRRAKAVFERRQKQLFENWKHQYYRVRNPMYIPWIEIKAGWAYIKIRFYMKPIFNTPLWLVNKVFTGLPDEVNNIYEIAKEDYLNVQRQGVHRIADIVEEELTNAKAEVDRGRQRVQEYVAALPDDLRSIGLDAAATVQAQFDGLEQTIRDKQNSLVDDLKAKYEASLKEVNERIEELKAANASLVSKIASALAEIGKWILRQVLNILKPPISLIPGIGSHVNAFLDAFVDDPGGVMNTLFTGIGEGFKKFGNNILKHVINGFFEWLLGSGIQIKFPDKFDLQGVIDILLQILGLTKDAIFELAASLMPDWAVELLRMLLDQGLSALSNLTETLKDLGVPQYVMSFFQAIGDFPKKGFMAIWDFIKDVFSSLKGEFITMIVTQVVIPEIAIAGIQYIIGLMNPASGIAKIVKMIVDVVIFLINNKDMIFEVLKSIGAVFSAVVSKTWQPVAQAVELALAKIIPLALGFFASLLGLGGIPNKIGNVVEKLRTPVDKGLGGIFEKLGMLLDPVGAIEGGVSGLADKAASKSGKKRNKKKNKDDDDDKSSEQNKANDKPPEQKNSSTPASSKNSSQPANKDSTNQQSSKPTGQANDTNKGKTNSQDKSTAEKDSNKSNQDSNKKKNNDDDDDDSQDPKKKKDDDDDKDPKKKKDDDKQDPKKKKKDDDDDDKDPKKKKDKDKDKKNNPKSNLKKQLKAAVTDVRNLADDKRDPDKVKGKLSSIKKKRDLDSLTLKKKGNKKYQVIGKATAKPDKKGKGTKARRKPLPGVTAVPHDSASVEEHVQRLSGQGNQLSDPVQSSMEDAFGTADFSGVRIHHDAEGDRLSRAMNAQAFTVNQDIFFRQGHYQPDTPQGKHLLAHELTHVQQQRSGHQVGVAQRKSNQGDWKDENNDVAVKKKKLKATKKKGDFTVEAKLVEKDKVLKKVRDKLKGRIKRNADFKKIKKYAKQLKKQYKLKALTVTKTKRDGSRYKISGEVDKKNNKSAQKVAAAPAQPQHIIQPTLETDIQRSEGRGQTLSSAVRAPLEDAFATDFSPVRIHTGNEGDRLSRAIQAKAFTTGRDIFFRRGTYAPETDSGQHLLAHELTHVIQQSGDQPAVGQRVSRPEATPPPVQRVADRSGLGLWIQRDAENTGESTPEAGNLTAVAAGAAAGAAASGLLSGGGKKEEDVTVRSRITDKDSKLTVNVRIEEKQEEEEEAPPEEDTQMSEEEETPEEALPPSLVNDIVKVIQDIVNQDPDPDTVARKLDKVRVMFEMQLVKLVTYAEVGDSFQYIVKINGRAKFIRASKIASFLKRLGGAARKGAAKVTDNVNNPTASKSTQTDTAKPITAADAPPPKTSVKAADPTTDHKTDTATPTKEPVADTPTPDKVTPSSTDKTAKSVDKIDQAQDRKMKVSSKVRRLNPETIDVIIRATPQAQKQ
ncbi:MAG: DUF4157 domain-containing protein [Cyanobacteria bacterium P01_D01_bin.156]